MSVNVIKCFLALVALIVVWGCTVSRGDGSRGDGVSERAAVVDSSFIEDRELSAVSLIREGLYYYNISRFPESEHALRKAHELFPQSENILLNLAMVLEAQELFADSLEIYEALVSMSETNVRYLEGAARSLYRMASFKPASEYFERALKLSEDWDDSRAAARNARSLSVLHFKLGDENRALCYSETALNHQRNVEQVLRHFNLLMASHRYEEARDLVDNFGRVRGVSEDIEFLAAYALSSFALNDFEAVLKSSNRAKRRLPGGHQDEPLLLTIRRFAAESIDAGPPAESGEAGSPNENSFASVEEVEQAILLLRGDGRQIYWPLNLLMRLYADPLS